MCSLQRNYDVIRNWERFETGPLTVVVFFSSYRINSTAAIRGTFILELMPPKHGCVFLLLINRENLANRHESGRIQPNLANIRNCFLPIS